MVCVYTACGQSVMRNKDLGVELIIETAKTPTCQHTFTYIGLPYLTVRLFSSQVLGEGVVPCKPVIDNR